MKLKEKEVEVGYLFFDQCQSIPCSAGDERWSYDLCAQIGRDCAINYECDKNAITQAK